MSTPTHPNEILPPPPPSTGLGVVVLLALAVGFAVAVISFGSTIYHREIERIEKDNAARKQQKFEPAPGMPPEPETEPLREFRWSSYAGALLGGEQEYGPAFLWALLGLITTGTAAVWLYQMEVVSEDAVKLRFRLTILLVGGLIGFFTFAILGLLYTWHWWQLLTGGRAKWTELKPWLPVGFMLLGLAVMFLCMLPIRSEERRSPGLRRLFYGYNTFLGCLLLLGLLAVANVMTFFYFTHSFDWTSSHLYSLSPKSRQVLTALDKPVKVYVFLNQVGQLTELYTDMQTLLNTSKQYSDKLEFEFVSPLAELDKYQELVRKYEVVSSDLVVEGMGRNSMIGLYGMLVVYDWQNKQQRPTSLFVGLNDLERDVVQRLQGQSLNRQFQGEKALTSALTYLMEGEVNYMLLFTTGNGEMSLTPGAQGQLPGTSLARLRESLRMQSGYECRTFPLGEPDPVTGKPRSIPSLVRMKTPAERSTLPFPQEDWVAVTPQEKQLNQDKTRKFYQILAVVVADPQQLHPPHLQTLREYLRADGKLIALLDVHRDPTGKVRRSGLEDFLRDYGVVVYEDQVLQGFHRIGQGQRLPEQLQQFNVAMVAPASMQAGADPGLAMAVSKAGPFYFSGVRTVMPGGAKDNLYSAQFHLAAIPGHWSETTAMQNPQQFVEKLNEATLEQKINNSPQGVPVAVTVVKPAPPGKEASEPPAPRMVVYGDATFLSDAQLTGSAGAAHYSLFSTTLSWLRGRKELTADVEPQTRASYRLSVSPDKLPVWSPGLLLLVVITAAGVGVTVLRRK